MEDIDKYLNDNASEEERQAAQHLQEGFSALRLEEKVRMAAAERKAWQQSIRLRRILGISLLIVVLLVIGWWLLDKPVMEESLPPIETEIEEEPQGLTPIQQETEEIPPPEEETEIQAPPPAPPPNVPIAQSDPDPTLPPPPYGAPATYLRGQHQQEEGKALLDQLWYTSYPLAGLEPDERFAQVDELLRERTFPTAYVRLQRLDRQVTPNDTLRYLQAYTLLEMGQGQEALLLMDQIEDAPNAWQAQMEWYRGLAALLMDDKAAAIGIFQKLAAQPTHPYRLQAQKALRLYE